jgi:hypothetical protein
MTYDPALIDETRMWLRKAALDLRAAEHDLSCRCIIIGRAVAVGRTWARFAPA